MIASKTESLSPRSHESPTSHGSPGVIKAVQLRGAWALRFSGLVRVIASASTSV